MIMFVGCLPKEDPIGHIVVRNHLCVFDAGFVVGKVIKPWP